VANKNPQSENLIPLNQRSEEDARALRAKGGKAAGEAKRRKKLLKDAANDLLDEIIKNAKGDEKLGSEALIMAQFKKALQGDTKAAEYIRDTAGQKPVDKIMLAEVDESVINEVERMVKNDAE
jgi:hypothetical protein